MSQIYSIKSTDSSDNLVLDSVWTQNNNTNLLAAGYTSLATGRMGEDVVLYAYNKNTQKLDTYVLFDKEPWIERKKQDIDLDVGPWDSLSTFVLGNDQYLMTYRREFGTFGFYLINDDFSISKPYSFELKRNTPTKGFTTVSPFTSLGLQYFMGYDTETGMVATFSLDILSTSIATGTPPLQALNLWYHQWARNWKHFAFFQLGGANFFFKINTGKLNVNIDHIQDNPSMGTVEVGSYLQNQLPDARSIDITSVIPWANDEPYILTYIASSGVTAIYNIHADCQGWTKVNDSIAPKEVSEIVSYRVNDTNYSLFYKG